MLTRLCVPYMASLQWVNHCHAGCHLRQWRYLFFPSLFDADGTGSSNSSSWKTNDLFILLANTMFIDDLAKCGARSSTVMTVWCMYWSSHKGCQNLGVSTMENGCHLADSIFKWISLKEICSLFFFSCDQAALWMAQSVRPSVCPSVCLSHLFNYVPMASSHHHEIFRSYYQWQKWCPCKRSRSKVKVTEVMTPLSRFRTLTPVWIHIWRWNDAQSLMLLRRGALLFFKVIRQITRSHG